MLCEARRPIIEDYASWEGLRNSAFWKVVRNAGAPASIRSSVEAYFRVTR